MYKLPIDFDQNEWFVIVTLILLLIGFAFTPRIFPAGMTVTLLLVIAYLALSADVLIGVDYPLNLYTIMDSPKLELFDVLIYLMNYPLYGYFFCIIIQARRLHGLRLFGFVAYWSVQTALIEWISVQFRVFTYLQGWNTGLSLLVYVVVFALCGMGTIFLARRWGVRTA